MREEIGTAQAAELLGLSVSTLKRLCDDQLFPSSRTSGRHRRFNRIQVELASQRMSGVVGKLANDARSDPRSGLVFMLVAGYEQGVLDMLQRLQAETFSVPQVLDMHLVPALLMMPSRKLSPWQIAAAESTARLVLDQLIANSPLESTAPQAATASQSLIVGVSAGTAHGDIASKLVEVALCYSGLAARNLGCVTSGTDLFEELGELNPSALWLAILHDDQFSDLATLSQTLKMKLSHETQLIIYSACRSLAEHPNWNMKAYFMTLTSLCNYLSSARSS